MSNKKRKFIIKKMKYLYKKLQMNRRYVHEESIV